MNKIYTSIKNKQRVQEKREQIITSVVKLFIKKGYACTSTREICKETGMTMGNLYDYIGKKEDLLYMVHDHMMRGIYGSFSELEKTEWINTEQLKSILKDYFVHSLKFKKEINLAYRETWLLNKTERRALLEKQSSYILKMKDFLDKGVKDGSLHIQDTQVMASFILYVIAMPALRSWNLRQYKGKEEELIDLLVNIIIKALV